MLILYSEYMSYEKTNVKTQSSQSNGFKSLESGPFANWINVVSVQHGQRKQIVCSLSLIISSPAAAPYNYMYIYMYTVPTNCTSITGSNNLLFSASSTLLILKAEHLLRKKVYMNVNPC